MPKLMTMKDPNFNPLQNYIIDKTLGQGTFGKVKLGIHKATGEKVGIKILEKQKIESEGDFVRVQREIHILRKIRHPNIIQLFEIIESEVKLYLIMEYAPGGELFDYIVSKHRLDEREACRIFMQLINAIEYLHQLGIVHRDLKPENILLDKNKQIKVVDFGLSTIYHGNQKLTTPCGSPCYAAPEMVSGLPYEGLKTDIWSSGIILYAMICGCVPFEDPNTKMLYEKIKTADFITPKNISPQAYDLLKRILQKDPNKRISIEDMRKHDFLLFGGKLSIPAGVNTKLKNFQDHIEVDEYVINELAALEIDKQEAAQMVKNNKHNCITATYYLLLNKIQQDESYRSKQQQFLVMQNIQSSIARESDNQIQLELNRGYVKVSDNYIKPRIKEQQQVPVPETGGSSSMEKIINKTINEKFTVKVSGKTKSQEPVAHREKSTEKYTHNKMPQKNAKLEYGNVNKSYLNKMISGQVKQQKFHSNTDSATYVRTRSSLKTRQGITDRSDRPNSNRQRSDEQQGKRSVENRLSYQPPTEKTVRQYRLMSTYNIEQQIQQKPIQTQPNERVSTDVGLSMTQIKKSNKIEKQDAFALGIQIYKSNIQNRFLIKQQQKRLSKQQ